MLLKERPSQKFSAQNQGQKTEGAISGLNLVAALK